MEKLGLSIVISLPFERIPSIEIGGANLRISQVLVIISTITFCALIFKKDKVLMSKNHQIEWWVGIGFFVFSIPSWFMITDVKRFLVTMIATVLCFGATFFVSLTTTSKNIFSRIQVSVTVLFFTSVFGVYQFFGDLVGVSPQFTGLREQYTKAVFGIPRIQSTAIEPLYYAGMLYIPILFLVITLLGSPKNQTTRYTALSKLTFFTIIFLLTISKGASAILLIVTIGIIIIGRNQFNIRELVMKMLGFFATVITSIIGLFQFYEPSRPTILDITGNALSTLGLESGSSAERLDFVQRALDLLPNNIITGIGSGQFGVLAKNAFKADSSFIIVNNVYLEVWLEMGILSLIMFVSFLIIPVCVSSIKLAEETNWKTQENISRITLIGSLIAYYVQWNTFSPIFIMPIFILIGLLSGLETNIIKEKTQYE